MNANDCYISLHRSEGFGLTIAEAEKPVIATGFSGNLDFMNEENSFLCPHTLRAIGRGAFYPKKGIWADADLDHAAYLMKYVFLNPDEANIKAKKGKEFILKHHSCEVAGFHMASRLDKISPLKKARPIPWRYGPSKLWHRVKDKIKRVIMSS